LHAQYGVLGNEKNVGNVAAVLLVEMTAGFRQFERFTPRYVLEIYNRIGHPTLATDDETFEVCGFLGIRIADLGILGHWELDVAR
jgi:hypothetical protein